MKCIVSHQEASTELVLREVAAQGFSCNALSPGVLLCEGAEVFKTLSSAAQGGRTLFIRHLFPVHLSLPATSSATNMIEQVVAHCTSFGVQKQFSLQIRIHDSSWEGLSRKEISQQIETRLSAQGWEFQRKDPRVVYSLLSAGGMLWGGLSLTEENLSSWPGGESRFREESDCICRAEFKLLEAFQVFPITVPSRCEALDLGAAPGGWSRILTTRGIRVTAVDPARLAPACLQNKLIHHVRATAQEYVASKPERAFALLVNDMRMDPRESAQTMIDVTPLLAPAAQAVMTLKLNKDRPFEVNHEIKEACDILRGSYDILSARQLFHNRSEVTLYLCRL